MEILEITMAQMPNVFTSNQFNSQAVKNGYPKQLLKRQGLSKFIRKYADNGVEFSKTWTKRSAARPQVEMTEQSMIEYLKGKGYKIMKPVNDWIEC